MAFDTEYDLVVVGGGASGKSAALEAARAGKSVVILEKMPETGGLSMFAEGTAAFESSEQKKLGKPAHPDRHFPTKQEGYDKFNAYSHYRANFDVVRAFVDNSADTIDFLKDLGVEYKTVTIAAYDDPNEVWTFHLPDGLGARVQELLLSAVEHAGVDIFTETPATELIIEDGKVVGVVAESEGEPLRVGGKAVVLATGGMGSNPELIAKYSWFAPSAYNMNTLTPLQNMGDGLMMALSAGADDTNIVTCPLLAAGARNKAMDSHIGAAGVQPGAIWINKTGRRFANEGTAENIGDIAHCTASSPTALCGRCSTRPTSTVSLRTAPRYPSASSSCSVVRSTVCAWSSIRMWLTAWLSRPTPPRSWPRRSACPRRTSPLPWRLTTRPAPLGRTRPSSNRRNTCARFPPRRSMPWPSPRALWAPPEVFASTAICR